MSTVIPALLGSIPTTWHFTCRQRTTLLLKKWTERCRSYNLVRNGPPGYSPGRPVWRRQDPREQHPPSSAPGLFPPAREPPPATEGLGPFRCRFTGAGETRRKRKASNRFFTAMEVYHAKRVRKQATAIDPKRAAVCHRAMKRRWARRGDRGPQWMRCDGRTLLGRTLPYRYGSRVGLRKERRYFVRGKASSAAARGWSRPRKLGQAREGRPHEHCFFERNKIRPPAHAFLSRGHHPPQPFHEGLPPPGAGATKARFSCRDTYLLDIYSPRRYTGPL